MREAVLHHTLLLLLLRVTHYTTLVHAESVISAARIHYALGHNPRKLSMRSSALSTREMPIIRLSRKFQLALFSAISTALSHVSH